MRVPATLRLYRLLAKLCRGSISILLLFLSFPAFSQTYSITGKVVDEKKVAVSPAEIKVVQKRKVRASAVTNKDGDFCITSISTGFYYISIDHPGYQPYDDSIQVKDGDINLGQLRLVPALHMLDEVKIVEKILAMVQKDDTLEFNSAAYKVNPDADGVDLVRKMESIEIDNKQITSQGENVVKILLDGKPLWGNDPYAALKNLSAEMISKVQVYNEKSDQEQFTGFSEGSTSKTINIITKAGMSMGVFGKAYAGYGYDAPPGSISNDDNKYGTGTTLNLFDGDRRIIVTSQSNNLNAQNFTNDNAAAGGSNGGMAKTNAGGINYTDKWGEKLEIGGSYFFDESNTNISRDTRKIFVQPSDSGQVYSETNSLGNESCGHRLNMRLTYTADSMNSVVFQPQLSIHQNDGNSARAGNTMQGLKEVNTTVSNNATNNTAYNLGGNLLLRHRFHKKGRTFSLGINASNSANDGTTMSTANNIYDNSPSLNDSTKQKIIQQQNTWNITAEAAYTEPMGKSGLLKLQYNFAYIPSVSDRDAYDALIGTDYYSTIPDSKLSNSFRSSNIANKGGTSYLFHIGSIDVSTGLNYQLSQLSNEQELPTKYNADRTFQNLLLVASLHYKISKTKNLQCTYNSTTQPPSISQLQNVINNNDPLHLYTGNPDLKQPFQHNLMIRYSATSKNARHNFSVSLSGRYSQHSITQSSIIAQVDTQILGITLAKGSQLTMPENIEGAGGVIGNVTYGLPLTAIKCHLNLNINAGLNRMPVKINNELNVQNSHTAAMGISLGSNISENIDFIISSNTNLSANANTLNKELSTTYINERVTASLNLILWKGIVFNMALNYQTNSGLTEGYNQNAFLCNGSIGKKLFKKHQGDIRLSVFDLLNENTNIQHTITETYIQDTRSNAMQRYFLLVFTYKIKRV